MKKFPTAAIAFVTSSFCFLHLARKSFAYRALFRFTFWTPFIRNSRHGVPYRCTLPRYLNSSVARSINFDIQGLTVYHPFGYNGSVVNICFFHHVLVYFAIVLAARTWNTGNIRFLVFLLLFPTANNVFRARVVEHGLSTSAHNTGLESRSQRKASLLVRACKTCSVFFLVLFLSHLSLFSFISPSNVPCYYSPNATGHL